MYLYLYFLLAGGRGAVAVAAEEVDFTATNPCHRHWNYTQYFTPSNIITYPLPRTQAIAHHPMYCIAMLPYHIIPCNITEESGHRPYHIIQYVAIEYLASALRGAGHKPYHIIQCCHITPSNTLALRVQARGHTTSPHQSLFLQTIADCMLVPLVVLARPYHNATILFKTIADCMLVPLVVLVWQYHDGTIPRHSIQDNCRLHASATSASGPGVAIP